MAQLSKFATIHDRASAANVGTYSKKSKAWFLQNISKMRNISRKTLLNDPMLIKKNKPLIGRMFCFFYSPKGKDLMAYYDNFPLIIMVGPAEDGFYGLNLHYLHPKVRAVFFDRLMEFMTDSRFDEKTRIKITYDKLKAAARLRLFQPCFKKYLYSQVQSKTVMIPASEWEIALWMPTDSFAGEDRQAIWKETRKFLR